MDFVLTIAGVEKAIRAGSLNIRQIANSRHTASFQLDSVDRSYRPAMDAEVVIEADAVRIFGGLIDRPSEAGLIRGTHPGIRTTVNVVDFGAYAEWRLVNTTFPEQTLKQRFQTIVDEYLDVYGVTLHASQVDGPTLPEVTYTYVRLDEVLNQQMALTADAGQPFVWRISYAKVLRAYQPSTSAAPFDLTSNDLPEVIGDVEVEPSNDGKANKIIVRVEQKTELGRTETFTGDGSTDTFELEYTPTRFLYGYVAVGSGGGETLGIPPDTPPGIQWTYDAASNTLTRVAGPPPTGETYSIVFDGVFSAEWSATDASWATAPRERVIVLDSIPSGTTGQAFADAELAKSLSGPTFVRYKTWEEGLEPGQQQTINISARNVNADGVITEIVVRDMVHRLERDVTVVVDDTQTNLDRGWGDLYRKWSGDKTGGGSGVVASSGSPASQSDSGNRLWHPLYRKTAYIVTEGAGIEPVGVGTTFNVTGSGSDIWESEFLGRRYTSGAVSGNQGGFQTSALCFHATITEPTYYVRMRTGSDITSVRIWIGMSNIAHANVDAASGLTDHHYFSFRYSTPAGDGGWRGATQTGLSASQSLTGVLAAIAADTEYLLKARVSDAGTAIHFSVNGGAEETLTTNLPNASTIRFGLEFRVFTNTAAARFQDFDRFYIEYGASTRALTDLTLSGS